MSRLSFNVGLSKENTRKTNDESSKDERLSFQIKDGLFVRRVEKTVFFHQKKFVWVGCYNSSYESTLHHNLIVYIQY